jgi:hypothetical protein
LQSVPTPTRVVLGLLVVAAAVAIAVAVVAPASSSPPAKRATKAELYRGLVGGVPLQSARCAQWNHASDDERANVAAALSHSVGGATQYGRGTTLSTGEAKGLFDRACSNPIAEHWLLYELYIRAAGMRSTYTPKT